MAKRKKPSSKLTVAQLENQASQHLANHRYKDALQSYKQLLKLAPCDKWQQALELCYRERALELSNKGMHKEALVLWENLVKQSRQCFTEDTPLLLNFIACLTQVGRYEKAASLYQDNEKTLHATSSGKLISSHFAAQLLLDNKECEKIFAETTPIRQHCILAKEALEHYSVNNNEAAENTLKQIPFRSSYRDFSQIIKALMIAEQDIEKAKQLLQRIPAESAFTHFASHLLPITFDNKVLLESLPNTPKSSQAVISELTGLPNDIHKVLPKFKRAQENPKSLFNLLLSPLSFISDDIRQQACFSLLSKYPAGHRLYNKHFGPLSSFEINRLIALHREEHNEPEKAYEHWVKCTCTLDETSLSPLEKAALYRHIANIYAKSNGHVGFFMDEEDIITEPYGLQYALQYDPDDKTTYIELIKGSEEAGIQKAYQLWVERAVKHFPKDRNILTIAIKAAQKKKAFKKAAGFAKKLLKQDPTNIEAKQSLVDSHLAHARKLLIKRDVDRALKEINTAAPIEPTNGRQCLLETLFALAAYQKKEILEAKQRISQAERLASNPLTARIILLVEAMRLHLPVESIANVLSGNLKLPVQTHSTIIMDVIKQLTTYHNDGVADLDDVAYLLQTPITNAAKGISNLVEYEIACECFERINDFSGLQTLAKQVLKQNKGEHKESLLFNYYLIRSQYKGSLYDVSAEDFEHLEIILDKAKTVGDQRTAVLVGQFLDKIEQYSGPFGWVPTDDMDDDEDDDFDLPQFDQKSMDALQKLLGSMDAGEVEATLAKIFGHTNLDDKF